MRKTAGQRIKLKTKILKFKERKIKGRRRFSWFTLSAEMHNASRSTEVY